MSSRKSKASKIVRQALRLEKKQVDAREKYRKPGESDEDMEARMKRDLGNWLDMQEESVVEEAVLNALDESQTEQEQ